MILSLSVSLSTPPFLSVCLSVCLSFCLPLPPSRHPISHCLCLSLSLPPSRLSLSLSLSVSLSVRLPHRDTVRNDEGKTRRRISLSLSLSHTHTHTHTNLPRREQQGVMHDGYGPVLLLSKKGVPGFTPISHTPHGATSTSVPHEQLYRSASPS